MKSQGGNIVIRNSMIMNPMKRTENEMREIQEMRRYRISDIIMNEEKDEEDNISSETFIDMKDAESLDLFVIALIALREIYDDSDARFKSEEQMKMIKLALSRRVDILMILSIEEDKSLMFQLMT